MYLCLKFELISNSFSCETYIAELQNFTILEIFFTKHKN